MRRERVHVLCLGLDGGSGESVSNYTIILCLDLMVETGGERKVPISIYCYALDLLVEATASLRGECARN
jgi:hypothetical protein